MHFRGPCRVFVYQNYRAPVIGAAAKSFCVEENGSLRAELEGKTRDGEL